MTINGHLKFFELSKALSKDGATAIATSGNSAAGNMLDFNKVTRWQSVGSDDSTTETLVITFPTPVNISRLLILNHNWKKYQIKANVSNNILDNLFADILDNNRQPLEDDGSPTIEFDKVVSITNSTEQAGISETNYSLSSSYYEFSTVYAEGLTITIDEAQELHDEGDQEKYCFMIVPTIEVNENQGTFELPVPVNTLRDFQSVNNRLLNGLYRPEKQLEVFTANLVVKLGASANDAALFEFLRYTDTDFLIWPNGGKTSPGFFRFNTRPYRYEDIYQVQVMNAGMLTYIGDIYSNPQVATMLIRETI
jgi:hypothetical protein